MSKKIKFNEVTVVDLEATTEDPQNREIIEIGVTFLDVKSGQIGDSFGILVYPPTQNIMEYCTNLTGIEPQDMENSVSLFEACEYLKQEYSTHKKPWLSWGAFDRNLLEKQCQRDNIPFPFTRNHIDLKSLFPVLTEESKSCGMEKALEKLNLKLEGQLHSGADDSYNIAKIFSKLLRK